MTVYAGREDSRAFHAGTNDNMNIRTMKIKDYDEVIAVWKAAGLHMDPISDSKAMIKKTLEISPKSCFVAVDQGKIVGAVLGAFNGRRVWVYHLGVLPSYQHKGVGTMLVGAVEKASKIAGSPKISLAVMCDNLNVVSFYKKLGFYKVNDSIWFSKVV